MIQVTDLALSKIQELSEAEGIGHLNIRIKVQGGGCAGFTHDMFFEDLAPSDMDEVFEFDQVKIIVDSLSLQYLEGVTIDYITGPMSNSFKFINPNVKTTCGCGSSFSV